jgi:hypothetical protein
VKRDCASRLGGVSAVFAVFATSPLYLPLRHRTSRQPAMCGRLWLAHTDSLLRVPANQDLGFWFLGHWPDMQFVSIIPFETAHTCELEREEGRT